MTARAKPSISFSIRASIERAVRFLDQGQWDVDLGGLPTVQAVAVRVTRVLSLALQGMLRNDCLTRASALTYITVLSLVPLLAFAFSMAKGFGAYERLLETTIIPFLDQMAPPATDLAPTASPEGAPEIRSAVESVLGFVGNTNFANLGLVGLTLLILAAIRLMTTIERVFNLIWGVPRARSWIRKVTDFVALLTVTPILLIIATTVTVSLQSNALTEFFATTLGLGAVVQLLSRLVPLIMVWLGFAFLMIVMPNTRVTFPSALVGGIVGGTVWQIVQVLHIQFQIGVADYNAIYAGFAALPLFLVWVYLNWVAVLLGGLVAWAHQTHPVYLVQKRARVSTFADREVFALRASLAIATSFAHGRGAARIGDVAAQCGLSSDGLLDVTETLVKAGLIASTGDGQAMGFLPARPLSEIRVSSVLAALRGASHQDGKDGDMASETVKRIHRAIIASPDDMTLLALVGVASAPHSVEGERLIPR